MIEAVSNNQGKPICFYKFAIDPFSLTYSVQNLFNLASLVKDGVAKIETVPGYYLFLFYYLYIIIIIIILCCIELVSSLV